MSTSVVTGDPLFGLLLLLLFGWSLASFLLVLGDEDYE